MIRLMRNTGLAIVLLLSAGVIWPLEAAEVQFSASVDRTTLDLSETVTLTLQAEGSVSSVPDPQWPDLSDFRILSGPNESSTFQIINGRYSLIKSWSFILKPKRSGTLTIGAAELEHGDQTYRTEPIALEVGGPGSAPPAKPAPSEPAPRAGKELPELFVQVDADKTTLYQNEQVILTYTIFTRVSVSAYEISRLPSTPGFWTEEFQIPPQPEIRDAVIAGRHYRKALIRKVALFSTRAGKMVVDPLEVTCQVQVQEKPSRRRDPFDMLFDSPFLRHRTVERFIETEPLTLNVLPLPAGGKPDNFSGAVGDLGLEVTLDRNEVKTNEALTMTARFSGSGNIKLLPEPDFRAPPDFEAYEPKESVEVNKTGAQIRGTKTFEYVLIPRVPGKAKIPPIEFSYFNPKTKSYRNLVEGGFEVQVQRGEEGPVAALPGISKEEVKLLAEDIHYLKAPGRLLRIGSPYHLAVGYWVAMALPLLIAIVFWWGSRLLGGAVLQAQRRGRKAYSRARRELHALGKVVSESPGSDPVREGFASEKMASLCSAVHRTLLTYLGEKLELPASGLKEDEVLERMAMCTIPQDVLTDIEEILQACNYARFTPAGTDAGHFNRILRRSDRALDKIEENWGGRR